jgi:hypothetical protein
LDAAESSGGEERSTSLLGLKMEEGCLVGEEREEPASFNPEDGGFLWSCKKEGMWIRPGVLVRAVGDSEETATPVVFGERGAATIGSGIVRRFKYAGVRCWSTVTLLNDVCVGGLDVGTRTSIEPSPNVDEDGLRGDVATASSVAASLDRSSHLPLTTSTLLDTLCDGVHLLVPVELVDAPVGFVRIELLRERLLLDRDEDVLSRSLVWYAKGPEDDPCFEFDDDVDEVELARSIVIKSWKVVRCSESKDWMRSDQVQVFAALLTRPD